jgi:rSAM/selenodomain-associated transferase 2
MISVIIPTYNEEEQIERTICGLRSNDDSNLIREIIVVDGGSSDSTIAVATRCGVTVIKDQRKGRASQMNAGASIAKHEVLYFLHADSIPPKGFTTKILNACSQGAKSGCFRLAFDYSHWFLKVNSWFTRFDINAVRFGDQSLFVTKYVFEKAGCFKEDLVMMEDQEIIHRLKKHGKFKVLDDVVVTSARKYLDNGVYRMQGIFYRIWAMYYLGCSQEQLLRVHRRAIRKHKL